MRKKLMALIISVLILSLMITACSSGEKAPQTPAPAEQKEIVVKGGSDGAPTMPANMAAKVLNDTVMADTKNRIKIEFYESRQLGGSEELLEQVMNGTIQFAMTGTSTMSKYTPLLDSLQVPFLLNTYEKEFAAVATPEFEAISAAIEEQFNIKVLGVFEFGIRHFANNKRPIEKLADIKGLKLRVVPSNLILETMKLLGANPTPMAYGEVYTALQNKVIDGCEINWTSIYSEKFYEQLDYTSEIGLFPFPGGYFVNLDFWKSLSPEDQAIFEKAAQKAMDENIKIMKDIETKARETSLKSGVAVNEVKDLTPFIEAVKPLYDSYSAKDPLMKNFIEMAKKL